MQHRKRAKLISKRHRVGFDVFFYAHDDHWCLNSAREIYVVDAQFSAPIVLRVGVVELLQSSLDTAPESREIISYR